MHFYLDSVREDNDASSALFRDSDHITYYNLYILSIFNTYTLIILSFIASLYKL